MKLNLLSFLLVVPCVFSALVTDYIVTTNVAGAVLTLTSIYDPASKITTTSKHTTSTTTPTTTTPTTTAAVAKAITSVKTLSPITVTYTQTAADGSLQNVVTTYTPLVSFYLTTNAAGQTITASTTTTPGFVSSTSTTTTGAAGVTTLNPVVTTIVETAADGALKTVVTTYTPYISQVLSTNPAGVAVTVTATITPGLSSTTTTTSATKTTTSITTGMVTTIITSSLADGALTTFTTVIPLASVSTSSYANSRHRPDPSTSVTPQPATPVTTLSWQSWATITEGDTTYTTKLSPIIVWITVTTNGALATISTTFIQRFSSQYSTIAQPSSGSIGLGTISGKIGVVKTEYQTTIKYNNAFNLQASHPILSICAILLSWLL